MVLASRFVLVAPALLLAIGSAQLPATPFVPVDDPTDFFEVLGDPTAIARQIDETIGAVLRECMAAQQQIHVVSTDARFDIEDLTFEETLDRTLERSFGDLVPVIVPEVLAIDPERLDDPTLIERDDLLIETDLLVDSNLIDIAAAPDLVIARETDVGLRLEPAAEGYGIGLTAYETAEHDPNIELVAQLDGPALIDYETALFGKPIEELGPDETGGCAQRSLDVLNSEVVPELVATDAELAALDLAIGNDTNFQVAAEAWSECVTASDMRGVDDLRTPDDAIALTRQKFEQAGNDAGLLVEARAFELQLAEIDFGCRARTTDLAIAAVIADAGTPYVARSQVAVESIKEAAR